VPFANVAATVACFGEQIGDHYFRPERGGRLLLALRRILDRAVCQKIVDPVLARYTAREEGRTAGRADRGSAISICKAQPAASHIVDIRCLDFLVSVAPQHPGSEVIGEDDKNVRALNGLILLVRRGGRGKQKLSTGHSTRVRRRIRVSNAGRTGRPRRTSRQNRPSASQVLSDQGTGTIKAARDTPSRRAPAG
jgi:hypothetical protein